MRHQYSCSEEYQFPAPGKCVTHYRSQYFSERFGCTFAIQGDKALHSTPAAAISYARRWVDNAIL